METQNKKLTEQEEFEKASTPLIEYLNTKCHPHMTVLVTCNHAELLEGIRTVQKK